MLLFFTGDFQNNKYCITNSDAQCAVDVFFLFFYCHAVSDSALTPSMAVSHTCYMLGNAKMISLFLTCSLQRWRPAAFKLDFKLPSNLQICLRLHQMCGARGGAATGRLHRIHTSDTILSNTYWTRSK